MLFHDTWEIFEELQSDDFPMEVVLKDIKLC